MSKFPPRVFCNEGILTGGIDFFEWSRERCDAGQIQYISIYEHESLLREAKAQVWEEAYTQIMAENSGDVALDFARIKACITNHREYYREAKAAELRKVGE